MDTAISLGPSSHLSWAELACHDGTPYPLNWRADRAILLAAEFEAIRALCGDKPLVVLSGFRTPKFNAAVGGAQHSQHKEGRALDLHPPLGMGLSAFEQFIRLRAKMPTSKLKGLGIYPSFLHIDVRPASSLIVWYGSRVKAELPITT